MNGKSGAANANRYVESLGKVVWGWEPGGRNLAEFRVERPAGGRRGGKQWEWRALQTALLRAHRKEHGIHRLEAKMGWKALA